jgi:hypothetical protein
LTGNLSANTPSFSNDIAPRQAVRPFALEVVEAVIEVSPLAFGRRDGFGAPAQTFPDALQKAEALVGREFLQVDRGNCMVQGMPWTAGTPSGFRNPLDPIAGSSELFFIPPQKISSPTEKKTRLSGEKSSHAQEKLGQGQKKSSHAREKPSHAGEKFSHAEEKFSVAQQNSSMAERTLWHG